MDESSTKHFKSPMEEGGDSGAMIQAGGGRQVKINLRSGGGAAPAAPRAKGRGGRYPFTPQNSFADARRQLATLHGVTHGGDQQQQPYTPQPQPVVEAAHDVAEKPPATGLAFNSNDIMHMVAMKRMQLDDKSVSSLSTDDAKTAGSQEVSDYDSDVELSDIEAQQARQLLAQSPGQLLAFAPSSPGPSPLATRSGQPIQRPSPRAADSASPLWQRDTPTAGMTTEEVQQGAGGEGWATAGASAKSVSPTNATASTRKSLVEESSRGGVNLLSCQTEARRHTISISGRGGDDDDSYFPAPSGSSSRGGATSSGATLSTSSQQQQGASSKQGQKHSSDSNSKQTAADSGHCQPDDVIGRASQQQPSAAGGTLRGFASGLTHSIIGKAVKAYANLLPGGAGEGGQSSDSPASAASFSCTAASSAAVVQDSSLDRQRMGSNDGSGFVTSLFSSSSQSSSATSAAAAAAAVSRRGGSDIYSRAMSLGSAMTTPSYLSRGGSGGGRLSMDMPEADGNVSSVCGSKQMQAAGEGGGQESSEQHGHASLLKIDEGYSDSTDSALVDTDVMNDDIDLLDVVLGVRRRSWYENEDGSRCVLPAVDVIRDRTADEDDDIQHNNDESNSLRVEADGPSDDMCDVGPDDLPQSPARWARSDVTARSPSKNRPALGTGKQLTTPGLGSSSSSCSSPAPFLVPAALPPASTTDDDITLGQIADMLISRVLKAALVQYHNEEEGNWDNDQLKATYNGETSPKRRIVPNMMDFLRDDEDTDQMDGGHVDHVVDVRGQKTPEIGTPDIDHLPSVPDNVKDDKQQPASGCSQGQGQSVTSAVEWDESQQWRMVMTGGRKCHIDMKAIEPYKKVISHGGYSGNGFSAIITLVGCYLPDRSLPNYDYIMEHLFLYVTSTLELLVVDDYMIVYFHSSTPRSQMPGPLWIKKCYDLIDRRLKKNLKRLLIVHPTMWLKTLMVLMKPFISSKFSRKLQYVKNLTELTELVPTEYIYVPDQVKQMDWRLFPRAPIPRKKFINL